MQKLNRPAVTEVSNWGPDLSGRVGIPWVAHSTGPQFDVIELLACPGVAQRAKRSGKFTLIELLACPGVAQRAKRSGKFTLIELLVVVAIIGMLVALLLPALRMGRDAAKAAFCQANERQLAVAVHGYAGDENDALPWLFNSIADMWAFGNTGGGSQGGYGGYSWALMVWPYVENIDLFACPSHGYDFHPIFAQNATTGHDYVYGEHYRVNPYFGCNWGAYGPGITNQGNRITQGLVGYVTSVAAPKPWVFHPLRLSRVSQASRKVCLFDAHNYHSPYVNSPAYARPYFADLTGDGDRSNTYNYNDWQHGRGRVMGAWHDKQANIAFLDGHVERVHWSSPKSYGDDVFDDDDITYYSPYE